MARSSNPSTLSPRERFQNSVRQLGTEDVQRHRRNKSIHLQYNPYELERVSSLRVTPVRKPPYKAGPTRLREVVEQPNFGTEERDIWSRKSPAGRGVRDGGSDFILHEDVPSSPSPQSNGFHDLPPLQPQIVVHPDPEDRPKTRRGPEGVSSFEAINNTRESDATSMSQSARPPKFIEGTMTSRSSAIASTWSVSDYGSSSSEAENTDTDSTPRPSRKRRSGSIDLREFQPPISTHSATKRTLFGKREVKKDKTVGLHMKPEQEEHGEQKKPKRRLRKSMSKLHFLGEKIKLFGSSTQELSDVQSQSSTSGIVENNNKAILDKRKRKAELAYAEQFGLKKQRDNDGAANVTSSPEMANAPQLYGNQKLESSTVRHRSGNSRSRRISTGSILTESMFREQDSVNEHDLRKRPTRRELEKENQQLRALLRESQAVKEQEQVDAYVSEPESIPPVPPLRIRRSYTRTSLDQASIKSNPSSLQSAIEVVPPLPPQHPNRRILSSVGNLQTRPSRRNSFGVLEQDQKSDKSNPLINTPKLMPTSSDKGESTISDRPIPVLSRAVSVIAEEPLAEIDEKKRSLRSRITASGKENAASVIIETRHKEEWQWPDDVF